MNIISIREDPNILLYLEKRDLVLAYKKAKEKIINGTGKAADFKIRKPKKDGIFQFRINRKYRAFCIMEDEALIVFCISDHQNS